MESGLRNFGLCDVDSDISSFSALSLQYYTELFYNIDPVLKSSHRPNETAEVLIVAGLEAAVEKLGPCDGRITLRRGPIKVSREHSKTFSVEIFLHDQKLIFSWQVIITFCRRRVIICNTCGIRILCDSRMFCDDGVSCRLTAKQSAMESVNRC